MSKGKQKKERLSMPQSENRAPGALAASVEPAFNGELPHSSKKEPLGPNTKR